MPDHPVIVVGLDGSERDGDVIALAGLLARATDAVLELTTVLPIPPGPWFTADELALETRRIAEDVLERGRERAGDEVEVSLRPIEAWSPARGLSDVAAELEATAVVVGRTHRGRLTHLAGVPERLLHGAPCAVAVAPPGYGAQPPSLSRILVAFDAYPEAQDALREAFALAVATGASVRAFGVIERYALGATLPIDYGDFDLAAQARASFGQELKRAGAEADIVVETDTGEGPPGPLLVQASHDAGLLVSGTRGNGPVAALLLGSVSSLLSHEAACPLLAIPLGAPALVAEPAADAGVTQARHGAHPRRRP